MGTNKIRTKFWQFLQSLSHPHSPPEAIALSFSLGTLIAILPTPGFGIFVGILLTVIFRSLSKIAMVISITFWNPILQVPVYYASYLLGSWLMGQPAVLEYDKSWLTIMTHYTQAFLLGNGILAGLISAISYVLVLRLLISFQRKKAITELISSHQLAK